MDGASNMNVGVLMWGSSAEREISLKSGAAVTEAFDAIGSKVFQIDPIKPGWIDSLSNVDFVFIALHGPFGEDGRVQGLLDLKRIPYSGSGVLGSALGMDKLRAKQLWRSVGIATPDFYNVDEDTDFDQVIDNLGSVFVKPISEGSSLGMAIASTAEELKNASLAASKLGSGVIAERRIEGAEYTVAILGDYTLPPVCIETNNNFFDYEAKYVSPDTVYRCPTDLGERDLNLLEKLSLKAFESLGCSVWGRVDVMRNRHGEFFVLEVNTIPGMTEHSLVPMAAAAANINMEKLIQSIVNLSLENCNL